MKKTFLEKFESSFEWFYPLSVCKILNLDWQEQLATFLKMIIHSIRVEIEKYIQHAVKIMMISVHIIFQISNNLSVKRQHRYKYWWLYS